MKNFCFLRISIKKKASLAIYMKRAIIIHGWGASPLFGWKPWLRKELEQKDFLVYAPQMPDTHHPNMDTWVRTLQETAGKTDADLYLIGHSLGCATILRYLETIERREKIGGAVLVAGPAKSPGYPDLENFFIKPFDWAKIKSACKKFISIHSDNDPHIPLDHGRIFEKELGVKLIIKKGMRHFVGTGFETLPIALESVLELSHS